MSICTKLFRRNRLALTLPEVLVTMAIFALALTGVLSAHVFGLKMYQITKAKLGTSQDSRHALNRMIDEIRSANTVRVGSGSLSSFSEALPNTVQSGNALQIHATTNLNDWVRYYLDPAESRLKRTEDGATQADVLAASITNAVVFSSEDFSGQILTNHANNRVVSITLQFLQLQSKATRVGVSNSYESFNLRTKITRRRLQ